MDGHGGVGRVRRRRRRAGGNIPAWALLLSAVVSCFDRDVRRKKRTHLAADRRPTKWWEFRLPVPPLPAPLVDKCTDCGTTMTPQWRSGPMGPRTLCTNCGSRRRLAGERWGKPRSTWRGAVMARSAKARAAFHGQPPAAQVSPPVSASSPPSSRICDHQGLAPAPDMLQERASMTSPPNQVTSPPSMESLPTPATAMPVHPPPQEILPVPASPPSSRICGQGLAPAPNVPTSPNQVMSSPPVTESIPAAPTPASAVSDHPLPPQEILPVLESPPISRICEQGLAPAPNVLQEKTSPIRVMHPATEPLPAPEPAPATAVSDHPPPPPQEILRVPSPPSNRICEQGLVVAPPPDLHLGRTSSPNPVTPPSPAPATATAGREQLPPPPISAPESSSAPKKGRKRGKRRWRKGSACKHCGSTTTLQWRWGPDGRRTVCNACGVRYRQGRLLPEYRPKASPTFDGNVHASRHTEVLRRRQRNNNAPITPAPPPALMTTMPLLPPPLPVVNLARASGINGAMEEQSLLDPFLFGRPAAPMPPLLLAPPPSLPVVNLASEACAGDANEDESTTNVAGTSGNIDPMEELGPLDPFLLEGPAAPMLFEEEEEPTYFIFFK